MFQCLERTLEAFVRAHSCFKTQNNLNWAIWILGHFDLAMSHELGGTYLSVSNGGVSSQQIASTLVKGAWSFPFLFSPLSHLSLLHLLLYPTQKVLLLADYQLQLCMTCTPDQTIHHPIPTISFAHQRISKWMRWTRPRRRKRRTKLREWQL